MEVISTFPKTRGRKQPTPALDQFADYLAEGFSVPDAAEKMGRQRRYGRELLGKICARLGDQAR